jgi:hypothetical protein
MLIVTGDPLIVPWILGCNPVYVIGRVARFT